MGRGGRHAAKSLCQFAHVFRIGDLLALAHEGTVTFLSFGVPGGAPAGEEGDPDRFIYRLDPR